MKFRGTLSLVALLTFAVGCSLGNGPEAQISIRFDSSRVAAQSTAPDAFSGRTASGLINTGFCYAFNVTGADLMRSVDDKPCSEGPKGLGATLVPTPTAPTQH